MLKEQIEKIKEKVHYCYQNAVLVMQTGAESTRVLVPDEDQFIIFTIDRKRYKCKIHNMVWYLTKGEIPEGLVVFHRDLCRYNNKIQNLTLVSAAESLKIKEAVRNLETALKVQKHPKDAFSYFIEYRENRVNKKETFQDVDVAKARLVVLQLKFSKVLDPYVISN